MSPMQMPLLYSSIEVLNHSATYPGKRLCGGRFDKKFVLQYLCCYIYIQENERSADERFVELRKLRTAFL